jgi:RNA polymerase sigma-70 factor (ECF subfamily)
MPPDAQQIAALVDRYASSLRALAAQWSGSPDDLVQEAFCRLMSQRRPPEQPGPWLFAVVRNLGREAIRGRRRRQERERQVAASEQYDIDIASRADAAAIVAHLDALDGKLREIVIMRLWGGLTLEEIAAACGMPVATVHRRYQAALEQLRERLKLCPNKNMT